MAFDYKIFWTDEALENLEEILDYLTNNWTQREVDNFKKILSRQVSLIEKYPKIFPVSNYRPGLRKAILSKQTTVFYKLSGQIIYIVYLFNSKRDIERIK